MRFHDVCYLKEYVAFDDTVEKNQEASSVKWKSLSNKGEKRI